MPSISKIRFTNIIYDNKQKRFNDDIFNFDGHNAAVLLENGGGKTVFIQCAIQAIIPHADLGERKIKETLLLDNNCAHIAIEWILKERPRKYCVTAVSLYKDTNGSVTSYRFINEYSAGSKDSIEFIPFSIEASNGRRRAASKEEIGEYYSRVKADTMSARTFSTIHEYQSVLSKDYGIIASEWRSQLAINKKEGGVEEFFDGCSTTGHLVDNLLIPSIEAVIAGDGEKGFAKTFESQRDVFKEYNRLTRLIKESDMAVERLSLYVKAYEKLDKIQQEELSIKRQAHALRSLANNELKTLDEYCQELNRQKDTLNKEQQMLWHKKKSLEVIEKENEKVAAEKALLESTDIYNKCKEAYDEKAGRKENIELCKANHEIEEWQAKIQNVKEKLEGMEKDTDIEEIRDEYDACACQLKGYYAEREENIRKKKEGIELQIKKCEKEKEFLTNEFEKENKRIQGLNNEKSRLVGVCDSNKESINDIKRKISVDVKNQRIEDILNNYNKRLMEIENQKASLVMDIDKSTKRIVEIKQTSPVMQDKRDGINGQLIKIKTELQAIDDEICRFTARLSTEYKEFYNLKPSNFYHKEKTITENFATIISKVKRIKEDALYNERLKKRLTDVYEESRYFTGDPELYRIIEELKGRFELIQAGGQYVNHAVQAMHATKEEILSKFPFWHYVVVVLNEAEVNKLKHELVTKELSSPILIVTLDNAKDLTNGVKTFDIDFAMPDFWTTNLDNEAFQSWKERIKQQGLAAEHARNVAEENLEVIQGDYKDTMNFFMTVPYENYLNMSAEKSEHENNLDAMNQRIDMLNKELDRLESERGANVDQKNSLELETEHISKSREYAQNILKLERDNKNHIRDIKRIEDQISDAEESIKALKQRIGDAVERTENYNNERTDINTELGILQGEEWYKAVRDNTPDMRGNIIKGALIEKLENLKLDLLRIDSSQRALMDSISNYKTHLEKAEKAFKALKEEAKYPWDDKEGFYEGMESELLRIKERLPLLLQDMNNAEKKKNSFDREFIRKTTSYEDRLKDFKMEYEDVYVFQQSISEAREALKEEEAAIYRKGESLNKQMEKAESEKKEAEQAVNMLSGIDRAFNYSNIPLQGETFTDALNYPYNRIKVVEGMDKRLQQEKKLKEDEEKTVNSAKRVYCERCRNELSDIRYKERLVEAVEKADNFTMLLENQKHMNDMLENAIKMANSSLSKREEDMYQFTNHLYTHVEKIGKELRLIPKKTRIRTGDEWKEIFDINVAEWDENEARMALRLQINYILERIDNNPEYKTDEGIEDITKIRMFIEKSLRTKQLLKRIMGSNEIRVRCRKVTNDNKVSQSFYSWEESEKWSGGERWSKNMALFLGIQNYIAEKTEPELKAGKSNSCVLLDNPFGKASSEHVLSPVFFIANELGFQIITVTAHAEGKFIGDYFPVVYSLRLREAQGMNTSVITKEVTIKHAYFEDKDPIALDRLTVKQQLSLF